MKKVALKAKPQAASPDEWVSAANRADEIADASLVETSESAARATAMKRLTIDIPSDLHTRIKMQCAARGRKMADEIRVLLEEHFSDVPSSDATSF